MNVWQNILIFFKEFLTILQQKDRYESSVIVKLDEIFNEIKFITSPYLTSGILNNILKFLSLENNYTLYKENFIQELEDYSSSFIVSII